MSSEEISSVREDIASLRAIVEERGKSASSNASMLRMIVGAVIVQLFCTVYFAGQKTQLLDRLQQDVMTIQAKLDSK